MKLKNNGKVTFPTYNISKVKQHTKPIRYLLCKAKRAFQIRRSMTNSIKSLIKIHLGTLPPPLKITCINTKKPCIMFPSICCQSLCQSVCMWSGGMSLRPSECWSATTFISHSMKFCHKANQADLSIETCSHKRNLGVTTIIFYDSEGKFSALAWGKEINKCFKVGIWPQCWSKKKSREIQNALRSLMTNTHENRFDL